MTDRPAYSLPQIGLHWAVAVLVLAAYLSADGMGRALRAHLDGTAAG